MLGQEVTAGDGAPKGTAGHALLAALDEADTQPRARPRRFARGELLFLQASFSERVVVLRTGVAKASSGTEDGREVTVDLFGPGSVLGQLTSGDARPCDASVQAVTPVEALVFRTPDFHALLATNPHVATATIAVLAARVAAAERRHREFVALDSLGRVSARLAELCRRFGESRGADDAGVAIDIPLSQRELAGLSGSSLEATTKALHTLRELGCVETARRRMVVTDLQALEHHAGLVPAA